MVQGDLQPPPPPHPPLSVGIRPRSGRKKVPGERDDEEEDEPAGGRAKDGTEDTCIYTS